MFRRQSSNFSREPFLRKAFGCLLLWMSFSSVAWSEEDENYYNFNIQNGTLENIVEAFHQTADIEIVYPFELLDFENLNPLNGRYTIEQALDALLKGTHLESYLTEHGIVVIRQKPDSIDVEATESTPLRNKQILTTNDSEVIVETTSEDLPKRLSVVRLRGTRQSLQSSFARKRDSDVILDNIVQEEQGKFPDSNLAESLQRVPGVTISRVEGEGQTATVRGFGPQFNNTLLNGRKLASDAEGRGFNFDLIPAPLVGGIDVLKAAQAQIQDGGIGATIDLQIQKPLDLDEDLSIINSKIQYENQSGRITPDLYGHYSKSFLNEKVGILLSASMQTRAALVDKIHSSPLLTSVWSEEERKEVFLNGAGNNGVDRYFHPQQVNFIQANQQRDRIGVTTVFQWVPNDQFELTVDGVFAKFKLEASSVSNMMFNEVMTFHNVVADENNVLISFDQIGRPFQTFIAQNRDSDVYQIGGKLEWQANEDVSFRFDLSQSSSQNNNAGKDYFVVIASDIAVQHYRNRGGYLAPSVSNFQFEDVGHDIDQDGINNEFDYVLGEQIIVPDVRHQSSWFSQREGQGDRDKVLEVKGDLDWDVNHNLLKKLRFGLHHSRQEKDHFNAHSVFPANSLYLDGTVPIPEELLQVSSRSQFASQLGHASSIGFLDFDVEDIISYLERDTTLSLRDELHDLQPGTSAGTFGETRLDAVSDLSRSYRIEEEVYSAFGVASLEHEINSFDLKLDLGARYSKTKTNSIGYVQQYIDIQPSSSRNDVLSVELAGFKQVESASEYDDFLPSLNFSVQHGSGFVFSTALSETISRPNLSDLNPGRNTPQELRLSNLTGAGGNPNLQPYRSKNIDLSFEYYGDNGTSLAVGLFRKKLDGFIVRQTVQEKVNVPLPNSLALIVENRRSILDDGVLINVTRPINAGEIQIDGVEFSFLHSFKSLPSLGRNLGVGVNLTYVDSNREFDTQNAENNPVLPGLSNSKNVVLFYDDGKIDARLAYTSRDRYFTRLIGVEPLFVDAHYQLDARVSINIEEDVQLFVEGINITDQYSRQQGRFESTFNSFEAAGPRFLVGMRYKF